jgi:serine/threonine protein kinase
MNMQAPSGQGKGDDLGSNMELRLNAGQIVGGRYEIISVLGTGGMGVVYKALQRYLRQYVALKTLRSPYLSDRALGRFRKEAKAANALNHPGLIKVYDFGLLDDGQPFMTMEFVDGGSLSDLIKAQGQLPLSMVMDTFVQASEALAYAHEKGIIHRDIKPSNILLEMTKEGSVRVKITDFGVAKILEDESGAGLKLTQTGEVLGSPEYMSPEQCAGKRADQRSDIYSLGCAMYEALTGAVPIQGETAFATLMKHQKDTPPSLVEGSMGRELPPALEEIVAKTMAKQPDDRYQSMWQLREDLAHLENLDRAKESGIGKEKRTMLEEPRRKSKLVPLPLVAGSILTGMVISSVLTVLVLQMTSHAGKEGIGTEPDGADGRTEISFIGELAPPVKESDKTEIRGNQRILHFPQQNSMGKLYKVTAAGLLPYGQAFGTRVVPLDAKLELRPTWGTCEETYLFDRFAADDFFAIDFENLPPLTDDGLKHLKHLTGLRELNVSATDISDRGLLAILDLPALKELTVSNSKVTSQGIASLDKVKSLAILRINNLPLDDRAFKYFRQGPHLVTLSLKSAGLHDKDLESLQNLKTLISLDLRDNKGITDAGLKYLSKLPLLANLDLRDCRITIAGLPYLKQIYSLRSLNISCKTWTAREQAQLKSELPKVNIEQPVTSRMEL